MYIVLSVSEMKNEFIRPLQVLFFIDGLEEMGMWPIIKIINEDTNMFRTW